MEVRRGRTCVKVGRNQKNRIPREMTGRRYESVIGVVWE